MGPMYVIVFNIPPKLRSYRDGEMALSLIKQTGEVGDRTCNTWFTRQQFIHCCHYTKAAPNARVLNDLLRLPKNDLGQGCSFHFYYNMHVFTAETLD